MALSDGQSMLFSGENLSLPESAGVVQLRHIITDRGSKYSVTMVAVKDADEVKQKLKAITTEKPYHKATHHTWAVRFMAQNILTERKNDGGETGAGMVLLSVLRGHNLVNTLVVVTRWYGGTKLGSDRFLHVKNAAILGASAMKHQR